MDMIAAIKKVLSPTSDPRMRRKLAINAEKKPEFWS